MKIMADINTNIVSNMQKYLWVNTSSIFPQDYGLVDTMIDLILGCIGALVVCIVGFLIIRKQEIYSKDTA